MTGPYGDSFGTYRAAGWAGVLPLPPRQKTHPPKGYTGENGAWPSYPDCHTWADGSDGDGNVALRMPHHVLGIDVDAYDNKPGADTLANAEQRWGALPATWRTTSRDDGASGIRLYRIPEGLAWPGEIGPGTELIQHRHRYAVVWPSIHPEGRTYRWITPEGVTSTAVPDPDTLPALPDTWIAGLTGHEEASATARNSFSSDDTNTWIATRETAGGTPCARMSRAVDTTTAELGTGSSAHNAARDGALRLVRLADEGHSGLASALADIHHAFVANVTSPRRSGQVREAGQARREWHSIVTSAVNLVTANSTGLDTCDCGGRLTGLIAGGGYPVDGATALAPLPPPEPQPQPDTSEETASGEDGDKQRTSWWPRSILAAFDGDDSDPAPDHLARADGARIFYTGKVNAVLGESESGKTWVALLAVTQALEARQRVTYLDFEDTDHGIAGRLRALGVTRDQLPWFSYAGPADTLHAGASDDLREHLDHQRPDLIVLDGFNAAMTLLGLDLDKNKDATHFNQLLLRPLADSGAAVVVVDHLPKNKENRGKGGIGAQAKRAMMTGCALVAEVDAPFGRGSTGRLKLSVDKDRPGHVRGIANESKTVGTAILKSDQETGSVDIEIETPDTSTKKDRDFGARSVTMEAICDHLAEAPERTGVNAIADALQRRRGVVKEALEALVEGGYVQRTGGGGVAYTHTLIRRYTIAEDLANLTGTPVPTGPEPVPGTGDQNHRTGSREGSPLSGGDPRDRCGDAARNQPNQFRVNGTAIDPRTGEILDDPETQQ